MCVYTWYYVPIPTLNKRSGFQLKIYYEQVIVTVTVTMVITSACIYIWSSVYFEMVTTSEKSNFTFVNDMYLFPVAHTIEFKNEKHAAVYFIHFHVI